MDSVLFTSLELMSGHVTIPLQKSTSARRDACCLHLRGGAEYFGSGVGLSLVTPFAEV